jgi:hypothetical protein
LPAELVACDENGDVEPAEREFGERVATVELAQLREIGSFRLFGD